MMFQMQIMAIAVILLAGINTVLAFLLYWEKHKNMSV